MKSECSYKFPVLGASWRVQMDRSPHSGGVVGATDAWEHQNYVGNEPDGAYGERTALLRGVRR